MRTSCYQLLQIAIGLPFLHSPPGIPACTGRGGVVLRSKPLLSGDRLARAFWSIWVNNP